MKLKLTHDTYRDGRWLQRLNLNGKYTYKGRKT